MKINTQKHTQLKFLDGLRGIAALYVVIFHARWLLWEGYSTGYLKHPQNYTPIEKGIMYFSSLFKFGHEAVLLFFVLSGFVIHLKYSYQIKDNNNFNFDLKDFFFRRINRIYPPLILSILLTYCFDSIGYILNLPIYIGYISYPHITDNITNDHTLPTLVGNLLFLMEGYTKVWGSNGPLWSLFYEWWFYVLYPLIFIIYRRSIFVATFIIFSFSILCSQGYLILPTFFQKILSYYSIWWFGVIIADIYTGRIKVKIEFLIPLILCFGIIPIIKSDNIFNSEILKGIGIAGFLSFCISINKGKIIKGLEVFKPLGDFSYTLYIVHLPILVFFSGLIFKHFGSLPSHFGFAFIGVIIIVPIAYLLYIVVEKPFNEKKLIIKLFTKQDLKHRKNIELN